MPTTVTQPEPIPPATRGPLIELTGAEKVYRTAIFLPRDVALACAGRGALARI